MDYIGNKCPVCEKYFHADEDVVVCPECGTPHHRACYEELGHCCNAEKHSIGFDYAEEQTERQNEEQQGHHFCPKCGKEVASDAFFCKYCGAPLKKDESQQAAGFGAQSYSAFQQGANAGPLPFLDPLGGVAADADFGDGVTAGETAKYVKQNTPYFVRVFNNIKNSNKSKFNFAAALFTGGYLLYRKMYRLGAILAAIQGALMILRIYVEISFSTLFVELANAVRGATDPSDFFKFFANLSDPQKLMLFLPDLINLVSIGIMLAVGFTFNRLYFKHCREQIVRIKGETPEGENAETVLQTKGGVNIPLAVSLLITYFIISYLPGILSALM